jgi:hypothetical protein
MIKSFGLVAAGVVLLTLPMILASGALAGDPTPDGISLLAFPATPASQVFVGKPSLGGRLAARHSPVAHAASTLKITDTAAMHYTGGSGSLLHESGSASGTLPGSMKATCNIGATLSTSFTIYASGGTITGHGTATPHGSGAIESFAGTLVATGGTGRYAHARGHAGLYGTFNRRNYALTVQTTGKLSY